MTANMTVSYNNADGQVRFTLACEHGSNDVVVQLGVGDIYPDEPDDAVLEMQSAMLARAHACLCGPEFVAVRATALGRPLDG